ncbi:MAG: hypothetical protein A2992_05605 [Elusimicrobia bacterium RIFCSPLOWO2_01_FULL_59_12]|nr:MAG: hypothetical protein A2992_05605 [Elusimicrobia bacterium RIFCSPLOWO2_01_FULL_59_12]
MSSAALVSSAPAAGCLSSATAVGACWEKELEKVRQAGEACQADIDAFCEGIQVGEGRLEACLKAHKRKLSKKCRESLTPSFPRTRESSTR